MGIQATMPLESNKQVSSATNVASGAFAFPGPNEVSIVTVLPIADAYKDSEIIRTVDLVLNYARDENLFNTPVSLSVVTTLKGGKAAIRTETVATNIVTGDVGIMIEGSVRDRGPLNIIENAHRQLLDWMRENQRLAL